MRPASPSFSLRGLARLLRLPAAVALALALHAPAGAQPYPAKPITLVVPFTPGGTTDIVGRILAEGLGRELKQTVVVENRGGAGGNIGAAAVAQARADGYTLLMGYNGTNAINPSLYKNTGWDPVQSFEPVSMVARVNNVVVVSPALPVQTLPELVKYASDNPGRLYYGSAGAGSIFHLAGEMLGAQAQVKMTHVPYKGAAPAVTDLLGGQVQVMFSTIPAVLPHIRSGKLRAIAVTGPARSPLFPELKTARESGYPQMVVDSWFAVFAPKGTPAPVVERLNTAVRKVLDNPDVRRRLQEQGAEPLRSSPGELMKTLSSDIASWRVVIRTAQVTLD